MALIPFPVAAPGIRGLLESFPESGRPLSALAQALLRGNSPLTPAEREAIAAFVSARNGCAYCASSHGATARRLLGDVADSFKGALAGDVAAVKDLKLRALLAIAEKVREGGQRVTAADVERAKGAGADDRAIHDTVLIAAAFSMYNRYVDGLGTEAPTDERYYEATAVRLATKGYV